MTKPNAVIELNTPSGKPVLIGGANRLAFIAGPCQLESRQHALETAHQLKEIAARLGIGLIYKTSFDKANRTSANAQRGLGLEGSLPIFAEIREVIAAFAVEGQTRITDLHVWRVGQGAYACTVSLVTHDPLLTPSAVREQLGVHEELVHVTVEIERCCTESADTK